ncbi:MAG: DUF2382 domain-containing protein [Thermoleophilia bacterium]|nr:DUF2382 domain-containing protein [Thermoleophilia bacterium]
MVRHEEELEVGAREGVGGSVRARKRVDVEPVSQLVDREVEHFDEVERVPVGGGDSGEVETLPDGSVSIPILEEELVVSKRVVVRERVIVRKRAETQTHRVEAELRKERIELDADAGVELDRSTEREG